MVKLFKNKVDITGVAVLLMAFFVAVGFTVAKEMQTTDWYEVEIKDGGSPTDPNDQKIGEQYDGEPIGDCDPLNSQTICAIQLTLGTGVDKPDTVQEAENMVEDEEDITIDSRAFQLN